MSFQTFTVLIVEDLITDRELYRRALCKDLSCVYDVLEAESVAAGLALCQTRSIDAVLLDYALPDGNGLDFLAQLSAQTSGINPPVVMISGRGNEKTAVHAIKLGAEDYLVKRDLTTELLLVTIRSAIENTLLKQQLQKQEERFRASVENMIDCFGIYSAIRDSAGQIVDFRFDYQNAAAMQSNRMTDADMDKTTCEMFPAFRETRLFAEHCQVVETGIPRVKDNAVYTDVFGGERLTKAYDVQIAKLDDGFTASWRDITAQKQLELSLIAANQQIATMWESMTDAYMTIDPDWRFTYANSTAIQVINELLESPIEDIIGKIYWDVFPWTVGTIVEQEYQRAVSDRVAVHFELFYEPAETWFEIDAYPSKVGLGIYFRDINERKWLECERIAAEQERDRFFDVSVDLLVVVNLDGYFVRVNPACEQILGFTSAEIMAQSFIDFLHPDDIAASTAVFEGLGTANVLVDFENRYRCKDESYRWILWNAILDPERNLIYASGRDITDRKHDEERLRQSEEFNRRILESNRDCIKVMDLDGRLTYMNDYGQLLMDVDDFSTVAESQWLEFWQGSDRESAQTAFSTALAGGVSQFDGSCITNKGTPKWWEVIVTPILAADGQVSQILSVSRDITDRKQTQADLEKRNKELNSFVYVVSHDLKAPLRAVANLSQWIEDDLEGQLTADNQSQMNLLRSRVQRMSSTIDGLLDYARCGHNDEEIRLVEVAKLLVDVIDSVDPPPTFTINLPTEMPTFFAKRLLLFQVLVNLIGNGIKHHHSEAGAIQISIEDHGDFYEFAIADNGPGIAPEHQEQMFKIFQAVNPQNRSDSTGIGLAIVKKTIEAEGGAIWLKSELGKGTTFYFTWFQR